MTSDTDKVGEPFKIEIDKGNKHKRFFEKGLNSLLADPHFLLLYVPENDGKMKVDEIKDYVDDEEGYPMEPVSMRPAKRAPLLALLKDHPGSYWWINVLCAGTDTPPTILKEIYSCCLECIAMIDCEPTLIPQLLPLVEEGEFSDENDQHRYQKLFELVHLLFELRQSRWWSQVWTWQDMALPFGEVRLMAETGTIRPQSNTITVDDLLDKFGDVPYLTLNSDKRCTGTP
ncbi:predicted protein [Lichtheimia corymbifera JMRC:FSU:9682]|uniref:Heterokaryon incompatibility domain-containing protein n=1 Tax=Lichtheimia corymbifera JMRC:FSU:9682 TaxID=1263082 RepID=A0A068RFB5_9FUNG|nr:predicted protein [Lichtheimia corymbifera JMRC:FSU:9682]